MRTSPKVLMSEITKVIDTETGNLKTLTEKTKSADGKKDIAKTIKLGDLYKTYKAKLNGKEDVVALKIDELKKLYTELEGYQKKYEATEGDTEDANGKNTKIHIVAINPAWKLEEKKATIEKIIEDIKMMLQSDEVIAKMTTLIKDINEIISEVKGVEINESVFVQEKHQKKYLSLNSDEKEEITGIISFLNEVRTEYTNISGEIDVEKLNTALKDGQNDIKKLKEILTDLITVKEARERIEALEKVYANMKPVHQTKYQVQMAGITSIKNEIKNKQETEKITLEQLTVIENFEKLLKDQIEKQKVTEIISDLMTVKDAKAEIEKLTDLLENKSGKEVVVVRMDLNKLTNEIKNKKDDESITQEQLDQINKIKDDIKNLLDKHENSEEFDTTEEAIKELESKYDPFKPIEYKVAYQDYEGKKENIINTIKAFKTQIGTEVKLCRESFNKSKEIKNTAKLVDINNDIELAKAKVEILALLPADGRFKTLKDVSILEQEEVYTSLVEYSGAKEENVKTDIAMAKTLIERNPLDEVKAEIEEERKAKEEAEKKAKEEAEKKAKEEAEKKDKEEAEKKDKEEEERKAKEEAEKKDKEKSVDEEMAELQEQINDLDNEVNGLNETEETDNLNNLEASDDEDFSSDLESLFGEEDSSGGDDAGGSEDSSDGDDAGGSEDSSGGDDAGGSEDSSGGGDSGEGNISFDSELMMDEDSPRPAQAQAQAQVKDYTKIKEEVDKFLLNFVTVNQGNNLVASMKLGQREYIEEISKKMNEVKAAFETGDVSDIVKHTREAITYKLFYDKNYIPYYVAVNSCKTFLDPVYETDLSEDDLKKVIIISYFYSRYIFDERFDITKTNASADIYTIIKNLAAQLYKDGYVSSDTFFDSIINIYTDDGSVYMNENEICNLDLAAKVLRMSETDSLNSETDVKKQVDDVLKTTENISNGNWQESYKEIEEKIDGFLKIS